MTDALEAPIELLKNFVKVFEKKNDEMGSALKFRNLELLSDLIDENKEGVEMLNYIIQDLDHIQDVERPGLLKKGGIWCAYPERMLRIIRKWEINNEQ